MTEYTRITVEIQLSGEGGSQEHNAPQTPEEWDRWMRRQHEAEARIREQLIAKGWKKAGPGEGLKPPNRQ